MCIWQHMKYISNRNRCIHFIREGSSYIQVCMFHVSSHRHVRPSLNVCWPARRRCRPGSRSATGSGCPGWLLSASSRCSGCEGPPTTRWSCHWWTRSLGTWEGGGAGSRGGYHVGWRSFRNKLSGEGNWLGLGFLQQGGVVGGQVNPLLVHVNTPGQKLELLLHMHHVLLNGMEGRLRPHFVCPPHVDPTEGQTEVHGNIPFSLFVSLNWKFVTSQVGGINLFWRSL